MENSGPKFKSKSHSFLLSLCVCAVLPSKEQQNSNLLQLIFLSSFLHLILRPLFFRQKAFKSSLNKFH